MAGDWIPMRVMLPDDPKVIGMAEALGVEDQDIIVGKLLRVWGWADQNTADGNARSVTQKRIDRIARMDGFAKAMLQVGWIVIESGAIRFHEFDRYMGDSGKKRLQTARRVAKHKAGKGNAPSVTKSLPTEQNNSDDEMRSARAREADADSARRPGCRSGVRMPTPSTSGDAVPRPDADSERLAQQALDAVPAIARRLNGHQPPEPDESVIPLEEANRRAAASATHGDELDVQIRAYLRERPDVGLRCGPKQHGCLRQCVELIGWARTRLAVDEAISRRVRDPCAYALGIAKGAEPDARAPPAAANGHTSVPRKPRAAIRFHS